jgi:hypothetical protein
MRKEYLTSGTGPERSGGGSGFFFTCKFSGYNLSNNVTLEEDESESESESENENESESEFASQRCQHRLKP